MYFISIIIPTYNRSFSLRTTLDSFVTQNYPNDYFEIIVANNNSTDSTETILKDYANMYPNFHYFTELRQGVHYARNTAAKHSLGEILYFTDDDMIAEKNLLTEIIRPFEIDSFVGSATGRVLPQWEIQPPDWIIKLCNNELLSLNDQGENLKIADYDLGVFSCHQAIKRDLFFETGGFNPENTSGEWIGDGETGLNIKIKNLGYKFAYNGKSVIYHKIPPSRMTQSYLNKRFANQGNCDSYTAFKKLRYSKVKLLAIILSHLKHYSIQIIKAALKFVLSKLTWRLNLSKSFYYLNRIKYDWRLIKDEKWRKLVIRDNWIND